MSVYEPEGDPFVKGKEFLHMFNKVAEFTKELLLENERLETEVKRTEEEIENSHFTGGNGSIELNTLQEELKMIEVERKALLNKCKEVESENKDFVTRYLEIEEENNNMANLYVASFQLHSTLDFHEVVAIIMEIIINLIGAEFFGLLLLDEKTGLLNSVAMEGFNIDDFPKIRMGEGIIGKSVKNGTSFFHDKGSIEGEITPYDPLVCVPLKIKERVIGAVVLYKLLQQKDEFNSVDYELFSLLAGHAATALFSAKLYSESERKLHTIQGFLELLTK